MGRGQLSGSRSAALAPRAGSNAWGALRNRTPILVESVGPLDSAICFLLPAYIPGLFFVNLVFAAVQPLRFFEGYFAFLRTFSSASVVSYSIANDEVACINTSTSNFTTTPRGQHNNTMLRQSIIAASHCPSPSVAGAAILSTTAATRTLLRTRPYVSRLRTASATTTSTTTPPTRIAQRFYSSRTNRPAWSHTAPGPSTGFIPPSPAKLGAPRSARSYTRTRRWLRRLLILSSILGAGYLTDKYVYASGLARSLRTFGVGLLVAFDYKLNFRPKPLPIPWIGIPDGIPELHRRNAERLFELLRHNGGLYLKIGQAIAMQSAVLPPEFQAMFSRMFDDAPQDSWEEVEQVIREDFGGRSVEEVFGISFSGAEGMGVMERTARASASVAQVHWARLPDGREVAIKIQKPEIERQIGWDLWAFK